MAAGQTTPSSVADSQQFVAFEPQQSVDEKLQGVVESIRPNSAESRVGACQKERIRLFLRAVCESPSVTKAHRAAGIDRKTHYDWMQNVPGYPEAFARASKIGWESLEAEAVRRAQEGYERPIYQAGKYVGSETVYSDRLTEVLLKGNVSKYKDQQVATGGISIHLAVGAVIGQPAAAPPLVQAIEVQALPAADPDGEFGIAL